MRICLISCLFSLVIALGGAEAQPAADENRLRANEMLAAVNLADAIFPAQQQFIAGAYTDLDRDFRGEYGFLPQLGGVAAPFGSGSDDGTLAAGELKLIDATLAQGGAVAMQGYHYRIYLPDAAQGAVDFTTAQAQSAAGKLDQASINAREKYFIAYAWPAVYGQTGRRVFMLSQDGKIYSPEPSPDQLPPRWDSALQPAEEGQPPGVRIRSVAWPQFTAHRSR